ncbi:ComEA family DNA-binding protein [Microbacterium testaceum]|uniref:ComEA family DNA-binding protein n=1 Tax=Microbacterium testaceum TaxID=2033 RepID=UPI001CD9BE99|nr:ComEA family DNA-binding protein [Microbacterium testaceum]
MTDPPLAPTALAPRAAEPETPGSGVAAAPGAGASLTGSLPARTRLGIGAVIVLVLLAFAVTIGIGMLRGATGAEVIDPAPSTAATLSLAAEAGVYVHIAGAVREPGLYRLDPGDRVADAVARAGGFADDAQRDGVNLARAVADGEQIVVPIVGAQTAAPASGTGGGASGTLDLNTATREQLDELPRVGPAMADRILEWRETNGRFTSVDDLLSVPGIGEKMLAGLRDLVRV